MASLSKTSPACDLAPAPSSSRPAPAPLAPTGHRSPASRPSRRRASSTSCDAATISTGAASRAGIFAIGDIAFYPGKLKLILSGFAEAALAAHAIHPLVHPGEALHFEYSTTKGLPGRS